MRPLGRLHEADRAADAGALEATVPAGILGQVLLVVVLGVEELERLTEAGHGRITTEILQAPEFYYAEDYHQQYLAKNPNGYCGLGGTGVSCPVGLVRAASPEH